jgi:hypothetical protein
MANFQIAIERPEEIIPRLGKRELHWKKGRSAFELSTTWMQAKGFPPAVKAVLDKADEWLGAELLEGLFERGTKLPGTGGSSQTDLLGIVAQKDGNAILGVEGKVDEPFGDPVGEWLKGPKEKPGEESADKAERERSKKNRAKRLAALCALLDIDLRDVDRLYYQLFHRTCAAIYEAKQFGYKRAVMLVHSFAEPSGPSNLPACFEEFSAFANAVGMPIGSPNSISSTKHCGGVELRLAWVSDKISMSQKPMRFHRIMNDFHRCKYSDPDIKTIALAQAKQLPSGEGIYVIWQGERCIYVGDGGGEYGIRGRIVPHHINKAHGRVGNRTKDTAGWREGRSQPWWDPASWEIEYFLCSNPVHRSYLEGAMLLEFKPWCNDQMFLMR